VLHISNGTSVTGTLERLFPGAEALPWNDVLHSGPVPAGLSLDELSAVRAAWIASRGWATPEQALAEFRARDAALGNFRAHPETVLWFEHDLYDELQLCQLLDWFNSQDLSGCNVSLIRTKVYLGPLSAAELSALFPTRRQVTPEQLRHASAAWAAVRAPDPRGLQRFPELRRLCEEYPWTSDGCSRTERAILAAAASGLRQPEELFRACSSTEEAVFMGDSTFFQIVDDLKSCPAPLLDAAHAPTAKGLAVLAGSDDRLHGSGIDRHIGGVHLIGIDSPWRWNSTTLHFHRKS
jgi:hypothetical protein